MAYIINGNKKIMGTVNINGSKNSALAIIVASIIAKDVVILENIPKISDVYDLIEILEYLNCNVKYDGYTCIIDSTNIQYKNLKIPQIKKLRASYYFMGAFLALFNEIEIYKPGGCSFCNRPIDIHLNGFKKLNAEVIETEEFVKINALEKLKANKIKLPFPSVGATINLILASTKIKGTTVLLNAAIEPEIIDLIEFLNSIGANIEMDKNKTIIIRGVEKYHKSKYKIIPDRIECGTYMIYGAALADKLTINNIITNQVRSLISIFVEMGVSMDIRKDSITIYKSENLRPVKILTGPYPAFPTDLQQIICSLLLKAKGESEIVDTIYLKRNTHIEELKKFNANVYIVNNSMFINHSDLLSGSVVESKDLRGGASLMLAAMMSHGTSIVNNSHFIERGYQDIVKTLVSLGADIRKDNQYD